MSYWICRCAVPHLESHRGSYVEPPIFNKKATLFKSSQISIIYDGLCKALPFHMSCVCGIGACLATD